MASTLLDSVSLRRVKENTYETLHKPERLGNTANIAFGGCTLAAGLNAAYINLPQNYHLYSAVGHYLGPALTDRTLHCVVRNLRTTRTFVTKEVQVSQLQDRGAEQRQCLIMLVDFQTAEPASLLQYSKSPSMPYTAPDLTPTPDTHLGTLVTSGSLTQSQFASYKTMFSLVPRYFDVRHPPEGVSGQNYYILAKSISTTQDHLHPTSKTSATYFRSKDKLENRQADHTIALAWFSDTAISFTPLIHDHMYLDDAGACGSLDFALRVFVNDLDLNEWHLREIRSVTAGEGRTYSEASVWDEKKRLVCSMTQQCILRPKPRQNPSKI